VASGEIFIIIIFFFFFFFCCNLLLLLPPLRLSPSSSYTETEQPKKL